MNEEQIKELLESNKKIEAAFSESQTELARIKEAMLLRDARDIVVGTLAGIDLPDVTRARLAESCSKNPPITDGVLDKTALIEAVKAKAVDELKYLETAAGFGKPVNVGESLRPEITEEDADRLFAESFNDMGFSANVVKLAVNGRG